MRPLILSILVFAFGDLARAKGEAHNISSNRIDAHDSWQDTCFNKQDPNNYNRILGIFRATGQVSAGDLELYGAKIGEIHPGCEDQDSKKYTMMSLSLHSQCMTEPELKKPSVRTAFSGKSADVVLGRKPKIVLIKNDKADPNETQVVRESREWMEQLFNVSLDLFSAPRPLFPTQSELEKRFRNPSPTLDFNFALDDPDYGSVLRRRLNRMRLERMACLCWTENRNAENKCPSLEESSKYFNDSLMYFVDDKILPEIPDSIVQSAVKVRGPCRPFRLADIPDQYQVRGYSRQKPKKYVFVFEGFGGFAERTAEKQKARHPIMGKAFIGTVSGSHALYISRFFTLRTSLEPAFDVEIFYYDHEDFQEAAECAALLDQEVFTEPSGQAFKSTINVLGFSNGGRAAIDFVNALGAQNIPVEFSAYIDTIPRVSEMLTLPFMSQDEREALLTLPSNANPNNSWYSFQRVGTLSGHPILGAPIENGRNVTNSVAPNWPHTSIPVVDIQRLHEKLQMTPSKRPIAPGDSKP